MYQGHHQSMSGRPYLQVRKTRLTPAPTTTYNLTFYHHHHHHYYYHHRAPSLTEEIFYEIAIGLLDRADLISSICSPNSWRIRRRFHKDLISPVACRLPLGTNISCDSDGSYGSFVTFGRFACSIELLSYGQQITARLRREIIKNERIVG